MQLVKRVGPQPGFQWKVMECPADVVVMGGSAGCGKSYALLLEPIRHLSVHGYNAMIFRRESVQIFSPGGLWDTALELYSGLPMPHIPTIRQHPALFKFPSTAAIHFSHLNQPLDVLHYQGAQIAFIGFDELTHFEEYQFFYMFSRNRTTCGVKPMIRASTNPQGEGWVKDLVQWWLYPDNYEIESLRGYPIPERAGVIRYMARINNETIWGDTQEEVWNLLPEKEQGMVGFEGIKSFTFIPGKLKDNPELLAKDPGYIGGLMMQSEADRVQLMEGRWMDPTLDQRRLYEDGEIIDFFTNSFVQGTGKRYLTADVALEGADRFVIGIWDGWVLEKIYIQDKTHPEEVQPLIEKLAKENRVPRTNIAFDATGAGAMLKGYLQGARVVVGASAPLDDIEEIGYGKQKKKSQYLNLRVQLYYKFKEQLSKTEAYCAVKDVDLRRDLAAELKAVKKGETLADQKLRVASKEEMKLLLKGKSPDISDMVVMRAIFELKPAPAQTFKWRVRALK